MEKVATQHTMGHPSSKREHCRNPPEKDTLVCSTNTSCPSMPVMFFLQ
jgi:hypothetical protein